MVGILLLILSSRGVYGKGYNAKEAARQSSITYPVPRVKNLDGKQLLNDYILRDIPVVIENVLPEESLQRLRNGETWALGDVPYWFRRQMQTEFPGVSEGIQYDHERVRNKRNTQSWGCARPAKQCAVAWWFSHPGQGAFVHTDAVCAPSWALQVTGAKHWTLGKRTAAEAALPVGDQFIGAEAYVTEVRSGDLLIFYNGWQPHSTLSAENGSSSVHGLIDFFELPQRLWSQDAVLKYKLVHSQNTPLHPLQLYATPSPRMLQFCPDLRDYGGFTSIMRSPSFAKDQKEKEESCIETNFSTSLWKPVENQSEPWLTIARDLGHLATPAAITNDVNKILVIGEADGRLWQYALPDITREDLTPALQLAAGGAVLAHSAPTLGDFDGDGKSEELVVGLYDGTIAFLNNGRTNLRSPVSTPLIRPSPLVLSPGRLLIGSESGDLLHLSFDIFDLSAQPRITPVVNQLASSISVLRLAVHPDGTNILVADGRVPTFHFARLYQEGDFFYLRPAPSRALWPFTDISLDAITEYFSFEVGAYPAPALADFNADGKADLVLGDLMGALLFFDGAKPIPRQFTEDAPALNDHDT